MDKCWYHVNCYNLVKRPKKLVRTTFFGYIFRRWTRAAEQWRQYHKDVAVVTKWLTETEKKLGDLKYVQDSKLLEKSYGVSRIFVVNVDLKVHGMVM